MIINHNMNALNAHRSMVGNTGAAGKSMEKLSSGLRINRAGDDAAGLAISEKMRGQIRGLDQASRNAQDGISMIQTAEGALNETHSILQRMRELSVQSANDTSVATDREKIQAEVDQLAQEITRISETTEFNTQTLLDGNLKDKKFQIGANESQNVNLTINAMDAKSLGVVGFEAKETTMGDFVIKNSNDKEFKMEIQLDTVDGKGTRASIDEKTGKVTVILNTKDVATAATSDAKNQDVLDALKDIGIEVELATGKNAGDSASKTAEKAIAKADTLDSRGSKELKGINVSNQESANAAITKINSAINSVSNERSNLGAMQNRLEHTINNLGASSENLTASESRIRDVDMAKEMMNFSKNNILQQAAQAMLAQANQQPQGVLQLLR